MAAKLLQSNDTKRKDIPTKIDGDGKSCGSVLRQVVEAMKNMVENLNNHIRNLEEITNILEIDSSPCKDQTNTDSHNGTLRQGRIALNTKELVTHTSDEFHKHLNRLAEVKSYINSFEKYLKTVSAQNRLQEAEPSRNPRSGRISSSASHQFDNGVETRCESLRRPDGGDFEYDALLSYDEEMDTFVLNELVKELQERRKIRIYIEFRDMLMGAYTNEELANVTNKSKAVIFLISKNFCKNENLWPLRYVNARSYGKNGIDCQMIPILMEKDVMVPDLLVANRAEDYTKYTDPKLFWDKLAENLRRLHTY